MSVINVSCKRKKSITLEHFPPLTIENTCARLQILRPQPLGQRDRLGIRRGVRIDGHLLLNLLHLRLPLPLLSLPLPLTLSLTLSLLLLLLLLLLHCCSLLQSAHPQLIDILLRCHARFGRLRIELLPLHLAELFDRHASLCGFGGDLLLHVLLQGRELLRRHPRGSGHGFSVGEKETGCSGRSTEKQKMLWEKES